jgi:hypothetical protein
MPKRFDGEQGYGGSIIFQLDVNLGLLLSDIQMLIGLTFYTT